MEILELELLTDDPEATACFYSEKLGLTTFLSGEDEFGFPAGKTALIFKRSKNVHPVYHFAFNIPINKLEESLEWVRSKNITLIPAGNSFIADSFSWSARSFYFYDNNGNILEFIARPDLGITSDEPFSAYSILSVSEIGIVTEDVKKMSEDFLEEYAIPVYSKWKSTEHFIPQGDENGLFILAQTERHWFPTNIPAKQFNCRVLFRQSGKEFEIRIP